MKISIAERLKPFSHKLGQIVLIPGSDAYLRAFPTRVELIHRTQEISLRLGLGGPVENFTLELDLEQNAVRLFGKAKEGFYRLRFQATVKGIELYGEKIPVQGVLINENLLRQRGDLFFPIDLHYFLPVKWERLSLGMSREQDWEQILRRNDLQELLPFLFALGQKCPYQKEGPLKGSAKLLRKDLALFCKAAFSHFLVPRLYDDQHQGIVPEEGLGEDPFFLLPAAARWIRSLFFEERARTLSLLPDCSFAAGRLTGVQAAGIGEIDLEWSRFTLKRATLRSTTKEPFFLQLPKGLHSFRIRSVRSGKGKRHQAEEPLLLEEGKSYFIDRFHAARGGL